MEDNIESIIFILFYLTFIWSYLIKIIAKNIKEKSFKSKEKYWKWTFLAYFLLAFGEIFHLGSRIYIYFAGLGLDECFTNKWVGLGYFISGLTMTYFYIALLHAWIILYGKRYAGPKISKNFLRIVYSAFIARVILMSLKYNRWYEGDATVDFGWNFRIVSSLPIYVIGILTLFVYVKASRWEHSIPHERVDFVVNYGNRKASYCFIVSFVTYSMTNFFVAIEPLMGLFMIPMTIAYMMAFYYQYIYMLEN